MPGYWNAHSDLDWYDACGMHDPRDDSDDLVISAATRTELLRQAIDRLERVARHDRWDMSARDYAAQAADFLRRAGLYEQADDCADEFGAGVDSLIAEITREIGHE